MSHPTVFDATHEKGAETGPLIIAMRTIPLAGRLKIYRRKFAATVDFDIEFDPVPFVETRHAGAFHGRDVHEHIGLAVIEVSPMAMPLWLIAGSPSPCITSTPITRPTTTSGVWRRCRELRYVIEGSI